MGPGTILGDRYAVRRRLAQAPGRTRWSAHDTTLEREVTITVFAADHPYADAALDAARRAAGVEDSRLVRVFDVGSQDDFCYIVEESLSGAQTVAALLSQGGLPAEEVRRIAGESATGLETGRSRGLHHLRLTPHEVLRAPDGSIKISGLAVAAALDGVEESDPTAASRTDAVALVALSYAALTSRWPFPGGLDGIESAPRLATGVPAPSEIAIGVPGDLDALCRLTLNEDAGPLTPGDLATQIAPWPADQVGADQGSDQTIELQLPTFGAPSAAHQPGASAADETALLPTPVQDGATSAETEADAGSRGAATLGGTLAAAGAVSSKVGSFARAAAGKAAQRVSSTGEDEPHETINLPEVFGGRSEPVEPPLPMMHTGTEAPTRDQSKLALVIVAGFVVVALLLAYCGVASLGAGGLPDVLSTPKRTVTVTASPKPAGSGGGAATTAPSPGAPISVAAAAGFDPQGDGAENDDQAKLAVDGNPDTVWTSEGYNSAEFGGLKKGVGLVLDLGKAQTVHQARLTLPGGPADLTLYATDSLKLDAGTPQIGSVHDASGEVTVKATQDLKPARYVIVWFTKLPSDGGRFRASVGEVRLS
jgi:eukaryotic-like serine/threonine-protein kinase